MLKKITIWRSLARGLLIILALIPMVFWPEFYDHFHAYLTGNIISRIITKSWSMVIISILFFALFLIPLNYRRRAKWLDYGLAAAFFVSLFIEMYGLPLTILFASKYFFTSGANLPPNIIEFKLFGVGMGMDLAMAYGAVLMALGILLIMSGWVSLYYQTERNQPAKFGLYALSRHPQYLGFILLVIGWFFGWPTIITLIFSPILIYKYLRAAKSEEQDMVKRFGREYELYRSTTPFII